MTPPILLLAALCPLAAAQELDSATLRKALDALRTGSPGQPAFDAATEHLPALIAFTGSDWFVAGGAYVAGRYGRKECVPALLAALERENRSASAGAHSTRSAILDALIGLDANVPVALLTQRLEESSLPETYVLLMRDQKHAADALLALFDAAAVDASARWAAACTLVEARDARVAERLLAGMEWELDFVVRDAGSSASIGYGSEGGRWCSAHERWPPRVTYELLLPEDDAPLSPIQHTRTERTRSGTLPTRVEARQRGAWKVRLIDRLLGDVEERGLLQRSEDQYLDWTDAEAYARALRAHCLSLRDRIARVAVRLETLGLLEHAQEVSASVALRVRIHGLRESPPAPLPPPPELPGVVYERQ